MNTILNIGLARNDGKPDNGVLHVVASLNEYGFKLVAGEVFEVTHAHGVEQTLIAEVEYQHNAIYLPAAVKALADELAQDCIAVGYLQDGTLQGGDLYGSKAAEWGPFNPQYFFCPTR
ncbi:hypothetical protein AMP1_8 [Burkholderia phage AMP1]|uniref:Uncharacterized protein n=5 Tax=Ampunavirus BpAMP1 TaxID=2733589 RepID=A0A5C2IBQ0_9CAUD|nr:hypothetical protein HOQ94_gp11 [Burkholderia phage Bp-AMP1]QEP52835.1 hypothetical protein AMP1_8 [Burkholderia phage AMP1]CDL65166.1 hypothetical protein [Burkholderia phage Bp-AMP2]CDL65206.1 hypothetical protein [Burkholderia phage Bp-AMP3]CDL65247.1 hypothetical protein [Burkholderia phage Bp-AMP4]CDK30080.1 hypothetical protein [Burkholderia phage Bp-AMP1]